MCFWAILLLLGNTFCFAQKKPAYKGPEVEVIEVSAHREEGLVAIDGRIKNSGEKPIKLIKILFDFMDAGKQVLTTQRAGIEQDVLAPGEEAEFHAQMPNPTRAVTYKIEFRDGDERDLRAAKTGPYPIE